MITGPRAVATPSNERIREALDTVVDPCSCAAGRGMGLVQMGLVDQVVIADSGDVRIAISLTSPACMRVGYFVDEIQRILQGVEGVADVEVVFDDGLSWSPDAMATQFDHVLAATRYGFPLPRPSRTRPSTLDDESRVDK
ncbi:MAG: DUF59 domain-containing protein [Actinobacteria bacterium]|uniref:Unannotated protein n=1 Tax=freshwater metagenome TaxID=449393 RepID=A0A6J6ZGW7_9ZZZZ|nr:DUF59 domain-containing protein [Actinomycetota bacterium]